MQLLRARALALALPQLMVDAGVVCWVSFLRARFPPRRSSGDYILIDAGRLPMANGQRAMGRMSDEGGGIWDLM